jgi:hypothetical protein
MAFAALLDPTNRACVFRTARVSHNRRLTLCHLPTYFLVRSRGMCIHCVDFSPVLAERKGHEQTPKVSDALAFTTLHHKRILRMSQERRSEYRTSVWLIDPRHAIPLLYGLHESKTRAAVEVSHTFGQHFWHLTVDAT